jgi:hypothetical protein
MTQKSRKLGHVSNVAKSSGTKYWKFNMTNYTTPTQITNKVGVQKSEYVTQVQPYPYNQGQLNGHAEAWVQQSTHLICHKR